MEKSLTPLADLLPAIEKKMGAAGMDPQAIQRELSFANQLIAGNDYLAGCSKQSLAAAVVNVANIGLTLNPASKEAYLVPRKNTGKNVTEANLQPSYIGLCKLITQAGMVSNIIANVVCENDQFTMDLADNSRPVVHIPKLRTSERGRVVGAYALATLTNGLKQVEWMDVDELYKVREMSESWKSESRRKYSPWENHEAEMMRKTVVRRIYKYLPRGGNNAAADRAIELDAQEYGATFQQRMAIDDLLMGANITPERQNLIYQQNRDNRMSYHEAAQIIDELRANQAPEPDPKKQLS